MTESKEEIDRKSKSDEIQDASTTIATKESDHEVATQKSPAVEGYYCSSLASTAISRSTNAYSYVQEGARAILRCLGFGKEEQRKKPSSPDQPQDQETQPYKSSTTSGSTVSETEATAATNVDGYTDAREQEEEPKTADSVGVSTTKFYADKPVDDVMPSSSHPTEATVTFESTRAIRRPSKPGVGKGRGPQIN